MKYDYIIVGGGIVGLSIAYHILKFDRSKSVLVLEKRYVGSGASTRNGSHFRVHFWSEENVRFAVKSREMILRIGSETGWNPIIMLGGYLWLICSEDILRAYEETNRRIWSRYNVPVKFLDISEIYKLFPYINTDGFIAGVYGPQDGKLHHDFVTFGYYYGFRKLGGKVLEYTPATKVLFKDGSVYGVETPKGVIEGDNIVVAAGDHSKYIMSIVDVDLPLVNERKELWVSEPVSLFIKPLIVDLRSDSMGLYIAQSPRGEVMGSIDYPKVQEDLEYNVSLDHFRMFSRLAIRLIPTLKYLRIMRTWSGSYVMSPDHSHILGRDDEWPEGLYVATGYSGHGFMMAPYTGYVMAKYLLTGEIPEDMKPYLPTRFKYKKLIKETMVIG